MRYEQMTPYDKQAWDSSIKVILAPQRRVVPARVRQPVGKALSAASHKARDLPGMDAAKGVVEKAFEGSLTLTFQPALRSARNDGTVKRFAKRNPGVTSLDDVAKLPLQARDELLPSKVRYNVVAAGQGAATAAAVTGAEVATTVSGGTTAAVAIGAVAGDAVLSTAMMGRIVGSVATCYGYDVKNPDEELYAMGVLSLGVATSLSAKAQALTALSRLTQQMMRQATWKQLNEHLLVQAIAKVYQLLGLRLTQRKLAQAVPVAGIGLNAALSAQLTEQTFRRAQAVYRLRVLSELYDIDPAMWVASSPGTVESDPAEPHEVIVDVEDILQQEIGNAGGSACQ